MLLRSYLPLCQAILTMVNRCAHITHKQQSHNTGMWVGVTVLVVVAV